MQILKKVIIYSLFFIVLVGCNKPIQEKKSQLEEYIERCLPAYNPAADEELILSTIAYMDNIIIKEGNKNIKTIYYNKAILLYMIKRYNEALDALFQTDDEEYDVHKSTLLIRLGRSNEAIPIFQKALDRYKINIGELVRYEGKNDVSDRTKNAIEGLMMYYILIDKPYESILHEFTSENILTKNEAEILFHKILAQGGGDIMVVKEMILNGLWPERDIAISTTKN